MADDDDLIEQLRHALDDAPTAPPADRIAELRARAELLRGEHSSTSTAVVVPIRRRSTRTLLVAAALLVGVVAGGVVTALVVSGDDDGDVAGDVEYDGDMLAPDGSSVAELKVVALGIGREIEIHTDVLPILPAGEYYEVWFVGPNDSDTQPNRISAGTFHPDAAGRSDVVFTAAVSPALYPTVEVTAEPGDGNPLPTHDVVLRADIPDT